MELTVQQFEQFDNRLGQFDNRLEQFDNRLEQFDNRLEQFDNRLQAVEQGQRDLEREVVGVKQDLSREIVASQARIIQWVVGLFLGSTVVVATLSGVYISVLLAR